MCLVFIPRIYSENLSKSTAEIPRDMSPHQRKLQFNRKVTAKLRFDEGDKAVKK